MPRVLTDFNDIDADGRVTVLLSHVEGSWNAQVESRVLLHDDGEHEAWATVLHIADNLITAGIDWSTWGPAGRYQIERVASQNAGSWNVGMMLSPPFTVAVGAITSDALSGIAGLLNRSATPSPPAPPATSPVLVA